MRSNTIVFKRVCTFFLALILVAALSTVAFSVVSQTPLFLTTSEKPNIVFLLDDSGSMWNVCWHKSYPADASATKYPDWFDAFFKGSADNFVLKYDTTIKRRVLYYKSNVWGGGTGSNTASNFDDLPANTTLPGVGTSRVVNANDNTGNYDKVMIADTNNTFWVNGHGVKLPRSEDSQNSHNTWFTGSYLNWLYYSADDSIRAQVSEGSSYTQYHTTRIHTAKEAIKNIINNSIDASGSSRYRWAGYTYTTSTNSAPPRLGPTTWTNTNNAANISSLLTAIDGVWPGGGTPLGNTIYRIWEDVFKSTAIIESRCQQNYLLVITDGYPHLTDDAGAISGSDSDYWYNPAFPSDKNWRSKAHIVTQKMHQGFSKTFINPSGTVTIPVDTFVIGLSFTGDAVTNKISDTDSMLYKMAVNGNGDAFGVSDSTSLISSLANTMNTIESRISSASSVAVNTAFLTSDTKLYRTKFNSGTWSGFLEAFKLNTSDGSVIGYPNSPLWEAGEVLNNRTEARVIYTAGKEPSQNYKRYEFKTDNASTISSLGLNGVAFSNFSSATSSSMVSYVRGDSTPTGYRTRTSKLGDMTYSAPVIAGPPIAYHSSSSYKTFKNTWAGRASLIMVGANDGMLHAFDSTNGQEKWAFIPNTLLPNLKLLRKDPYVHQNYVGGTPTIVDAFIYAKGTDGTTESARSWRTVLVCGLREGGKGYFALDVTNPDNPIPLWEISPSVPSSNGLGYTFGAPLIVKLKAKSNELDGAGDRWVALVPNGYEGTTTGKAASLLVVDLGSGAIVKEIVVDTNTNFVSGHYNGLSSPAAVDINADGLADYVYAGDLKGNLWKFDLRDIDSSKWDVSYRGNRSPGTAYPLFTGYSSQPITTAPDIVLRSGCQVVFFGTGKYYDETVDKADTATQSIYGLYDYNVAKNSPSGSIYGRANLVQQTFTDVIVAGETYRTSSNNSVVPGSEDNMKKGWYVDLWHDGSSPSERIVTDPVAHAKKIIFTTFIPSSAACSYGGTSWLMELNMDTGGTPTKPTFDVNKDNYVNANDVVNDVIPTGYSLRDGISSTPTIVGDKENELKYITKTTGEIVKILEGGATSQFGLRNWRQLR